MGCWRGLWAVGEHSDFGNDQGKTLVCFCGDFNCSLCLALVFWLRILYKFDLHHPRDYPLLLTMSNFWHLTTSWLQRSVLVESANLSTIFKLSLLAVFGDSPKRWVFYVQEEQNDTRRSLQIIDKELNGHHYWEWLESHKELVSIQDIFHALVKELSTEAKIMPERNRTISSNHWPETKWTVRFPPDRAFEYDQPFCDTEEEADIVRLTIKRTASLRSDERAKTNYKCIYNALMSITTYLEDMSAINMTSLSCSVIVEFMYVACYCSIFIIAFAKSCLKLGSHLHEI